MYCAVFQYKMKKVKPKQTELEQTQTKIKSKPNQSKLKEAETNWNNPKKDPDGLLKAASGVLTPNQTSLTANHPRGQR